VWSGGPAGQVDRLDGDGRQRASATTVSCGDDQVPVPVAGAGSVWAAVDRDNVVGRIDPETGWLVARIAVPLPVSGEAAVYRVVGGDRTAWVLDEAGGGVHELDLERNVARVVPLPGPPDAVVDAAMIAMPGG
jgi:streptogramin lyase